MHGKPRTAHTSKTPAPLESDSIGRFLDLAALSLFIARWFTPTEGATRGDTLWIAQLWIGWAAVAAWLVWRDRQSWSLRFSWLGLGIAALVVGHLVSGSAVLLTTGQKRAALNGMAEWTGIGLTAAWLLTRARQPEWQRAIVVSLVSAAVAFSGLGLWQRLIWRPALAGAVIEYEELEKSVQTLDGEPRRETLARLQKLRREVGPEYVGLDSNGRMAMRQRLVDSIEPLGFFALANSFAGFLTPAAFLAGGLAVSTRRMEARAILGLFTSLIGFVVILAKSRTAWVGSLVGIAAAAVHGLRSKLRIRAVWIIGGLVGITALFGLAAATGGLDRLVLSEAPKSLRYRLEYWWSSWQLIQHHPLLGVGPGNFRQNYLQFKLPESSEEILDPHNMILDVWANGGLLALLGLAVIIGITIRNTAAGWVLPQPELTPSSQHRSATSLAVIPLLAGPALVLFESWFLRDFLDPILIATALAAAVIAAIVNRMTAAISTGTVFTAAWIALTVHLLGAGGIAMPAIATLWLWLASATTPAELNPSQATLPRFASAGVAIALSALFVAQLKFDTSPVLASAAYLAAGDAAASVDGNLPRALQLLQTASQEDRLDPEPHRRLAQVEIAIWQRTRSDAEFEKAIQQQREAILRDPANPHDRRALGDLLFARYEADRNAATASSASDAYSAAIVRYPNHSFSQAGYARAQAASGNQTEARSAAHRALELDQLNRDLQHYDRLLPDDTIAALRAIDR